MSSNWDAVIIGGGPAGSTAAMTLAKEGRKVLVLEKETFPRFHIGESLLPYNVGLFQELGIWEKIQNAGFMVKRGAQFWTGDATLHMRLNFGDGSFTDYPDSVQVERAKFDLLLLNHARECGAEVREGSIVLDHVVEADGVKVRYRGADGQEREERGAFLVDASGLGNFTANREGIRKYYAKHKKVAIFGHFNNVEMPQDEGHGDILIIRRTNSWCWMIPLSDEKTSVGLVMDRSDFQAANQKPDALFNEVVANTPALQNRLKDSTMVSQVHVLMDFSYQNEQLVAPRLVRVGDASGFIDPIFSSGVFLAMQSGNQAGREVHTALEQGAVMTEGLKQYEKDVRKRITLFWEFIEKFYTKNFTELFLQPDNIFRLPCAVNCVLAGRSKLPFAVRWRLRVFFLLVWIQKWFPLAEHREIS